MPSDETRDSLLDAAKRVMQRDGAGNLTLDAVAKEAGVSKGGLLYHFPSKQALLRGMVAQGVCQHEREMMVEAEEAGEGGLACAFLSHALFGPHDPSCKPPAEMIWSVLAAAANDPALLEPVRETHGRWRRRMEDDGVDPDVATVINLVSHGLFMSEVFGFDVPDDAQRGRLYVMLCRMAGVENSPSGTRREAHAQEKR